MKVTTNRLREKMPSSILTRQPPPPAKNPFLTSDRKATIGEISSHSGKDLSSTLFAQEREERSTQQTERLLPALERRSGEPSFCSNVRSIWRRYIDTGFNSRARSVFHAWVSGAGKVSDAAVPCGGGVQGGRAEHRAQRGDLPRGAQQDGRLRQADVPRLRHRLDGNGHLSRLLQVTRDHGFSL